MNIGSIVKKAASTFARSKTNKRKPVGTTTHTTHSSSAKADLARGAAKMAKKKL